MSIYYEFSCFVFVLVLFGFSSELSDLSSDFSESDLAFLALGFFGSVFASSDFSDYCFS